MSGRRGFITGLVSLIAAPAIVRAGSLMPVKTMIEPVLFEDFCSNSRIFDVLMRNTEHQVNRAMMNLGAFGRVAVMFDENGPRVLDNSEVWI
jgi:hypothetical protein